MWGRTVLAEVTFLNISIRTPAPKHPKLRKRLDRREKMGDLRRVSLCSWLLFPPEEMKTRKEGRKKRKEKWAEVREWDCKEGKPLRPYGVGECCVMKWKTQPVGHAGLCGSSSSSEASKSSLGASYLVLVGARIQEKNLPLTPLLVNKPNTVGKMRGDAEDAHALLPSLTLSLLIIPKQFPLVSVTKLNITPIQYPELMCFEKIMCFLFICGVLRYTSCL